LLVTLNVHEIVACKVHESIDRKNVNDMNKTENKPETPQVLEHSVSSSYIVFEHSKEQDGLVQLSVTLPTIERARSYVNAWKSKRLYIYQLVE